MNLIRYYHEHSPEVTRNCAAGPTGAMTEHEDGNWVRYEDIEPLFGYFERWERMEEWVNNVAERAHVCEDPLTAAIMQHVASMVRGAMVSATVGGLVATNGTKVTILRTTNDG